jgi:hypothetical protein
MLALTAPIATSRARANALAQERISVASPRAVPVAWHSRKVTVSGPTPATVYACRSPPVVAQPDAPDHAEHADAARRGVGQAHHGDHGRALRGDQAVRLAVQRTAPAARAERGQRGEPGLDQQRIRAADAARQHQVGGPVVQAVAGELQREERGGAGGVERERAGTESERAGAERGR